MALFFYRPRGNFLYPLLLFSYSSFSPLLLLLLPSLFLLFEREKREKKDWKKKIGKREKILLNSLLFFLLFQRKKRRGKRTRKSRISWFLFSTLLLLSLFTEKEKRGKITLTLLLFSPREGGEKGRNIATYKIFLGRQKGPCFFITRSWFRLYFCFIYRGWG